MEFHGHHRWLADGLPNGFYKNQHQMFQKSFGQKLELTHNDVDEYWENNSEEYKWRFEYNGMVY